MRLLHSPCRVYDMRNRRSSAVRLFFFVMSIPEQKISFTPQTLLIRLILLRGVVRRFFLNVFRPGYVRESLAQRKGECERCGVCCHLVANKCGALHLHKDGQSTCRLYSVYRLPNCRNFPIDPRDLKERNLVAPNVPCGYSWPKK